MKHFEVQTDDLRERFILFLASKPADQPYIWESVRHCPCGTFIREVLPRPMKVRPWYMFGFARTIWGCDPSEVQTVWRRWNDIAHDQQHTYGALLQRVRSA